MTDWGKPARLRDLGLSELHAAARHSLNFYNNVAVSARYTSGTIYTFTQLQRLVFAALNRVVHDNPSLSAVIVDEDKPRPHFARLPRLNLEHTVTFIASEHLHDTTTDKWRFELDRLLESQHNTNFKTRKTDTPLWRLVVLHERGQISTFCAAFVFHHSIADGTSGTVFHRQFCQHICDAQLRESARSSDSKGDFVIVSPSERELLPDLFALHPLHISWMYFAYTIWTKIIWPTQPPASLWTGAPINYQAEDKCHVGSLSFSKGTTTQLLQACRANCTTMQALIECVFAVALFAKLPEDKYTDIECGGDVSLRRWLTPGLLQDFHKGGDIMGTYVSQYTDTHQRRDCTAAGLWNEARRVKSVIDGEMMKKGTDTPIGLLRYIRNMHDFFTDQIGKTRDESFEVSNLGRFSIGSNLDEDEPASDDSAWKISRMVFSQSANVTGAAIVASVITGPDGCLNVALSWLDSIVEADLVQEVANEFERLIHEVIRAH